MRLPSPARRTIRRMTRSEAVALFPDIAEKDVRGMTWAERARARLYLGRRSRPNPWTPLYRSWMA